MNKVSVVFRISGAAVEVASLASSLESLNGDLVYRPQSVPPGALPEAWWAIEVSQRNLESTEPVISAVLDRLEPMQSLILSMAGDPRFLMELDCTVEVEEERPVLEVSPPTLERLASLKAALGFEVHDYSE